MTQYYLMLSEINKKCIWTLLAMMKSLKNRKEKENLKFYFKIKIDSHYLNCYGDSFSGLRLFT